MQDLLNSESNDEIDLRELFAIMWAYKLFIACTCALSIVFGGYFALNADKEFTSAAIFRLNKNNSGHNLLGQELGTLATLAGLGDQTAALNLPKDQVTGRIFIEKLDANLNFQADPYFNTYNPNSVDPYWKSIIKSAIGWQESPINAQEATWQGIIAEYIKNVALEETPDKSIKILVTHVNPQRAAKIANVIMDEIISTSQIKINTEQDKQLSYLSNTLSRALIDLEVSQSKLSEFALENSALPLENFAAGSLQLDILREKLNRASELHKAMAALSLALQHETKNRDTYLALRQKFPIVDQVEFRRILGQNEIISAWSWPKASTVDAVYDTLTERKSRLQSRINASQINAERSGLALEEYAKIEREAKVAEATYTVLIEQVKAQSMAAGYRPNEYEVYEYASPSISPSAPRYSLILGLGAILGLFIGAALSFVLALHRDVYYSKNSLFAGAQARLTASARTLLPLRNRNLIDIKSMLMKKPLSVLRDVAVEIHKNAATQVVVTSSGAKLKGNDVARTLASYMQSDTMKVALIDFSSRTKKLDVDPKRLSVGPFVVTESTGQISILGPGGDLATIELLSQKSFWGNIQLLNSTFDLVFLCADNEHAISLLSALEEHKTFHITIVKTKKTKSTSLIQMRSLLPIQGLLYE